MSKNLTKEEWIKVTNLYKEKNIYEATNLYLKLTGGELKSLADLRKRIRKKAFLVHNNGMEILDRKAGSGRPTKRDDSDIPSIIDDLTEQQKRDIIEDWIKEQRKKKKDKMEGFSNFSISLKARILQLNRTTFYKKKKERQYKYEYLKEKIINIFKNSKEIYGSRRIIAILNSIGIFMSDRTLRNYMKRWRIFTLTRKKKRKSESKNTKVNIPDLVLRNFNPKENNIIATDVSYIPAAIEQNNIYLSAAINHKTKRIEAWELSEVNDTKLVINTIKKLNRRNFILHSDHGSQYSSIEVSKLLSELNSKSSMGRVGNSLDNREIEYFFSCLKSEYLNHIKTWKMNINQIRKHIDWYINWYNEERIQSVLKWKTPAYSAGVLNA